MHVARLRLSRIKSLMNMHRDSSVLAALRDAQSEAGCLAAETMAEIAERYGVTESHLYGVATFYSLLYTKPKAKFVVRLCSSVSCHMTGSRELLRAARDILGIDEGQSTADGLFALDTVSCLGACHVGPAAMINGRLHTRLTPESLAALISEIKAGRVPNADDAFGVGSARAIDEPVLLSTGAVEVPRGLTSEQILTLVGASELKGRGGAGYPTALKWRICARAPGDDKYVVCNADEGEPGTFKDRFLLVNRPDLTLKGMELAARAVGARKGYIYLRGEYEDARQALEKEIAGAGYLSLHVEIVMGVGAYVCGEETALLESIEGQRGVPRLRPPYPPTSGLFGCPTVINNVETLSLVPLIVARGADWFAGLGTPKNRGTKLFPVSGDVERPGVIEAPFGTSLDAVLSEAGAGELKAALVGGASGRLVPADQFGRNLCEEDLPPGAGSIIAIGRDRSIRDVCANLMAFFDHESCGECAPCRIGTARANEILAGKRSTDEPTVDALRRLGETLVDCSRCGLGQTAPRGLLDALQFFQKEFD
jgi:[NiFe] hydrogenase diaphorase moiety large subunit